MPFLFHKDCFQNFFKKCEFEKHKTKLIVIVMILWTYSKNVKKEALSDNTDSKNSIKQ